MQVEDKEINGFLIETFNQHGLEVGKTCVHLLGNLKIRKLNALLMIGSVVSVLAITVTNLSSYIHSNVKAELSVSM